MQHLKLSFAIILSASLLFACSGNCAANVGKETVSHYASEPASTGDDVSFYNLDGTKI